MSKQQIQDFIKSGEKVMKFDTMLPVRKVEESLVEIGFDELELDGGETNGWQIDFWYKFYSEEYKGYTFSGSLHYGDFQLSKN
jgi:hypothetical protein